MSLYLAVDLGTTGCRSILFDESLKELGSAYEEYGLITPDDNFVEQDAQQWWSLTLKTAKKAIKESGVSGLEIDGISVSSQGITIVPVDKDINPIYNAISWLDMRAEKETEGLTHDFGAETIFKLTGKALSGTYTLPKLLWIKNNLPDIYNAAYKFLMPLDFLTAKFTGKFVTDYSMATGTLMYDIKNQCWSDKLLERYGISKEFLPEVISAGSSVGTVLPEVAREMGLKDSCIVVLGAQDQKCAAYGVGLTDGVMTISLGTAAAVTKLWNEVKNDKNNGVGWCGYINRTSYVTEGVIDTAGTCLRWVRDMLYKSEDYSVIDKEAKEQLLKNKEKPLFFYPFMSGKATLNNYPEATGFFYGVNLSTVRGDFALAVMEGIAYQIRLILQTMQAYGNVHTLIIFGGVARSKLWCQLISDITGMEVYVPANFEASSVGAARLAAIGCGKDIGPIECVSSYKPSQRTETYNKKFIKYFALEKKILGVK